MAITGKPLGATAGAMIFQQGGNAVDAACAMLAATCTMWDVLSWGGETQALIYNPHTGEVIAINALGVAPTGATAEFYKKQGLKFPPSYGPLAAVTPGTPGGLITMLSKYGKLSLKEVLAPAMEMANGYPIEAQTANAIERDKEMIKEWPYAKKVFLPHLGKEREAPYAGEIFEQHDLLATLQKLVDTETEALSSGKSREEAMQEAYDRFYKGDIAEELTRSIQEQGGLIQMEDLASWKVKIESPLHTNYKGIDVYKLQEWTQGPALLQSLNILENFDLKGMGFNSANYIHTLYQAMNLAFADRDFYYGDPDFSPKSPMKGLLSKEYASERAKLIDKNNNDPWANPGDPYPFQGEENPFKSQLEHYSKNYFEYSENADAKVSDSFLQDFTAGTTSIVAADKEGWVVSITPSGGWIPAVIAGNTGIGLSQRMQSFVLDEEVNPFNVVAPGKRPRVTLTPSLALKDGKPLMAFAVQGGDTQDQNLLQFFLNMVEFDMNVQQAVEAPNINSYQMQAAFGNHEIKPGALTLQSETPSWVRRDLQNRGYKMDFRERTSGPITAIWFDWKHGTLWGGASNHGEDYGIGW
ncbi:gamma-glutamyltransferase family protein [Cyclobacterium plantarum]|uniref:Gamma-glutamyltransferase family protein n=1 Tax=Cyclobacterium plantarum TaxID=2716263 RepID=A0ABX0HBC2_9BACT|nr:gamma-glutamyltransferase [Cyclobacterium plantarum]NHE57496.1 gamma-glutamyltransferase family protein [Cyclobacterium plantarum]